MADYLKAYQTTGQSPKHCPRSPTDRAERARAGLPPLFEPYIEIGGSPAPPEQSAAASVTLLSLERVTGTPPHDLSALPDVQFFQATPDTSEAGNKVFLQNVVCQHMYSAFSPEVRNCPRCLCGK